MRAMLYRNKVFAIGTNILLSIRTFIRKAEDRFDFILVAIGTNIVCWFGGTHSFLTGIHKNATSNFLKFIL
jgi:hypothetical protein